MKKVVLTTVALILVGATAFAAPLATSTPGKITGSKHDIGVQYDGTNGRGEICIYCHTPHNATVAVPLWNRNNPSASLFSLYNSPTLTSASKKSVLTEDSISLFCMSCHDGITGLGEVRNAGENSLDGRRGANRSAPAVPSDEKENARLGLDLTSTHPVGFTYREAYGEDNGINSPSIVMKAFQDNRASYQSTAQYFLYGQNRNLFECASCHRVHDPGTSGNFLRIENDGSQLCFACHRK